MNVSLLQIFHYNLLNSPETNLWKKNWKHYEKIYEEDRGAG